MLYSAIDIANYFIRLALSKEKRLTPLQVIKLTYVAHGWNLGLTEEGLINEPIQAWKLGPVVPSVYFAFQGFRGTPIDKTSAPIACEPEEKTIKLLDRVYDKYSIYSGPQLTELTHQKGTPWEQTVRPYIENKQELPRFLPISDEVIKAYYQTFRDGRTAA